MLLPISLSRADLDGVMHSDCWADRILIISPQAGLRVTESQDIKMLYLVKKSCLVWIVRRVQPATQF